MWHCQLIDQDQAIHRTLFQVIYCQPSPSKHCTPKLAVFFWWWAKCHLVVAMLTAKKIYKPLACRLPRSNAQTLWTLNWRLVTPRSDLGVDLHISGPVCFPSGRGEIWTMSVWWEMVAVVGRMCHMKLGTLNFSTNTCYS